MGRVARNLDCVNAVGSPSRWLVVFDRSASSWWTSLIAFGHYKHCRAFGWIEAVGCYVFVDCQLGGMTVQVATGEVARALMLEWTWNADVLAFNSPAISSAAIWRFAPLLCTTVVARLLGLSMWAWRPDALYVECTRAGGVPVTWESQPFPKPRPNPIPCCSS